MAPIAADRTAQADPAAPEEMLRRVRRMNLSQGRIRLLARAGTQSDIAFFWRRLLEQFCRPSMYRTAPVLDFIAFSSREAVSTSLESASAAAVMA
ncbi:hypothetical protein [Bosea sp. WAO]|uniref:hypothetical protein n=1 Tax=Bosea sp. WAO TaxID=406341 RepID=UPI000AC7233F|nr:hypothetical protein [Bosea sp. WAO]